MPAAAPVGAPSSSLLKEAAQQATLPGGHQQPTPGPQQDGRPKSSAEWVEALVQQMAGASDIQDARARAAQVLQAFEQALLEGAGSQVGACVIAYNGQDSSGSCGAALVHICGAQSSSMLLAIWQVLLQSISMHCSLAKRLGALC